ncbi:arginine deiminase family protein [Nocardioides bruguierae]|uniref:Arginine deiminase family protein n=1 Tax=Nocardioides bruguierae TaxID=2945102 RepID=A0A9X2DAU8_9ACTN|nr:arginine deiminase family protein [Nocardioides bruguierae]MCM0622526.1 arginine deiminase family protein [Nocardioides bruguierae]
MTLLDSMPTDCVVSAWNEWDRLREMVVGTAVGANYEPTEPGSRPQRRGGREGNPFPTGPKPQHVIDQANEELQGLVQLLQDWDVVVRRPSPVDFSTQLVSPDFSVENQYCAVCPRDVLITVGSEIIEAPMSRRARFFEYLPYRDIVRGYWKQDQNVRWTAAPKPSMHDRMYRQEFWEWPLVERHKRMHDFEFCVTQEEVLFDAADASRFGNDIIIQESMTTNRAGIEWLRRHLQDRGIRVHAVHFPLDLFPSHIDCTFVPLRPGLILTNPERPILEGEDKLFLDSGWKLVDAPQPSLTNDQMPEFCQSSKWLSMNVLSLSPDVVICEENEHELHELLSREGLEVLTIPFRGVYEFGGSLHCATWDVRREGKGEDLLGISS